MNPVDGLSLLGSCFQTRVPVAVYRFFNQQLFEIHSKPLNAAHVRAGAKSRTQEELLTIDVLVLVTMKNATKCDA